MRRYRYPAPTARELWARWWREAREVLRERPTAWARQGYGADYRDPAQVAALRCWGAREYCTDRLARRAPRTFSCYAAYCGRVACEYA